MGFHPQISDADKSLGLALNLNRFWTVGANGGLSITLLQLCMLYMQLDLVRWMARWHVIGNFAANSRPIFGIIRGIVPIAYWLMYCELD